MIPLIAIQMIALKRVDEVGLLFITFLDQTSLGFDEEEDEQERTDRAYWENSASKKTVEMADQLLEIARQFDPTLELKYNKFYIGLVKDGIPTLLIIFKPQKSSLRFEPR